MKPTLPQGQHPLQGPILLVRLLIDDLNNADPAKPPSFMTVLNKLTELFNLGKLTTLEYVERVSVLTFKVSGATDTEKHLILTAAMIEIGGVA